MAIRRRQQWLSQQRVDVPHLRSIESAVSNDFDELLKSVITGEGQSYVIRGFEINMTGLIGSAASGAQMLVADSAILHGQSRESGTFYVVSSTQPPEILNSTINPRVQGAFTPNAVNYIGIEYERVIDNSTTDQVYFWNPSSKTETSKSVPLASILRYKIVITTSVWAQNVLPIAKITTDAANNVVEVTDHRPMLYRLGTGGRATPNPSYVYPWTDQTPNRHENPPNSSSSAVNPFRGGDKQLGSLKEWMDAVMTSILEIKGTVFWYSPNVGGSAVNLRTDLGNTVFTGHGSITHHTVTAGRINWSQDIVMRVIGSRLSYTLLANPTSTDIVLADNQVAYINIVRGQDIVPNLIFVNGSAVVTSVGAVSWTSNVQPGDFIKLAAEDDTKYYKILTVDSLSQVTLTEPFPGTSTGPSGAKAKYAWGTYQTSPIPSTNRHIRIANRENVPSGENVYWLLLRSDNGGSTPRVYARFVGQELEQGETVEINDTTSEQLFAYVGSAGDSDNFPVYSNKLGPLLPEITDITCPPGSSITSGQYFLLYAAQDLPEYYVWYNVNGGGGNPSPIGKIPIQVNINSGDSAAQVATATAAAINAVVDFNASASANVVTVTNATAGMATDASNVNVSGLSITIVQQGSGAANHTVVDGDNLTLAIKRLDNIIAGIVNNVEIDYEEKIEVVASSPGPNQILGPVPPNTTITIPLDSRNGNAARSYVVGNGELEVYLNGIKLILGSSWDEVGLPGSESVNIEILEQLEVGDILIFRIDPSKVIGSGGGGGGGEANTASNIGGGAGLFSSKVGTDLQFKSLVAGPGVTITPAPTTITISAVPTASALNVQTVTGSNYNVTAVNDVILVDTAGANRTITLPSAVGITGKVFYIKKISATNTMFIKSVLNQTLDGVNIDSTPLAINTQYESVTLVSDGANYWII
jgi:hypothetical protein